MAQTPKYERGGQKETNKKYRSRILEKLPRRLNIPEDKMNLSAGVWTLDYQDLLLIQFETTGGSYVDVRSKVSGRTLVQPSRRKLLSSPEEIIEKAMRRLTPKERKK